MRKSAKVQVNQDQSILTQTLAQLKNKYCISCRVQDVHAGSGCPYDQDRLDHIQATIVALPAIIRTTMRITVKAHAKLNRIIVIGTWFKAWFAMLWLQITWMHRRIHCAGKINSE